MFLIVIFFDFLSESIDWSQNFYTKNKTQKFCSVRPQMDLFPFFVHFLKILVVLRHCLYCLVLSQLNFSTFAFYKIAKLNARKSVFPVWCNYVKMMSLMTSQLIAYLRLIVFFFKKKKRYQQREGNTAIIQNLNIIKPVLLVRTKKVSHLLG